MQSRIRDVRRAKGLTLADVAERCTPPTTAQTIGRLETGMRVLSLIWINRIADALERVGVKIDAFSVGFGPELFGFNDRHGTRWRIAAIPLCGWSNCSPMPTPRHSTLMSLYRVRAGGSFLGGSWGAKPESCISSRWRPERGSRSLLIPHGLPRRSG